MLCANRSCYVPDCVIDITKIKLWKTRKNIENNETPVLNYFEGKKRKYYNNLEISLVTDNKKFCKTVNPFFSEKLQSNNKIVLIEDETIISNDVEVAETMNEFFVTVMDSLGINENSNYENATEGITDPIDKAVHKFSNHPSILKIKSHYQNTGSFIFRQFLLIPLTKKLGI